VKLEHRVRIEAPADRAWELLMDVPRAAGLIPGVEAVEPTANGGYRGRLRVQIGPIRLAFEGDIAIEGRDDAAHTATMRANGTDRSAGGGVRALVGLALAPSGEATELTISTDLQLAGRIGELGQPLVKRKADQTLDAFAANLRRELA
jgi:uncharacterized protein